MYQNLGKNLLVSILDVFDKNPYNLTNPNEVNYQIAWLNSLGNQKAHDLAFLQSQGYWSEAYQTNEVENIKKSIIAEPFGRHKLIINEISDETKNFVKSNPYICMKHVYSSVMNKNSLKEQVINRKFLELTGLAAIQQISEIMKTFLGADRLKTNNWMDWLSHRFCSQCHAKLKIPNVQEPSQFIPKGSMFISDENSKRIDSQFAGWIEKWYDNSIIHNTIWAVFLGDIDIYYDK